MSKKFFDLDTGKNVTFQRPTQNYSMTWDSTNPSMSELLQDFKADRKLVKSQKRKWLEPKPRNGLPCGERKTDMKKNTLEQDMDVTKDDNDGVVLPKKKTGSKPSNKPSKSPAMQVMTAVAKAAQNPGKKKKPKVPSGPSRANQQDPQSKGRHDYEDSPSVEKKGKS